MRSTHSLTLVNSRRSVHRHKILTYLGVFPYSGPADIMRWLAHRRRWPGSTLRTIRKLGQSRQSAIGLPF
jgi:hypothetical protein